MAAGAWTFTDAGRTSLLNGDFDLDTNTFLIALFTSASNLGTSSTTYAGVTGEVSNANGYTTGGISISTLELTGTTTVKVTETTTSMVWNATSAGITAKFAAIYKSAGNVLCYCTLDSGGADVTATAGNSLTITMNASGIFTVA